MSPSSRWTTWDADRASSKPGMASGDDAGSEVSIEAHLGCGAGRAWPIGSGWEKRPGTNGAGEGGDDGVLTGSAVSVSPAPLRLFRSSSARFVQLAASGGDDKGTDGPGRGRDLSGDALSRPRSTRRGNSSMAVTMSPAGCEHEDVRSGVGSPSSARHRPGSIVASFSPDAASLPCVSTRSLAAVRP